MNNILLIGSKPYKNFQISRIIDTFENNFRFNFSLPDNNNGSICDNLGLCNHLYDNLILKNISYNEFNKIYSKEYRQDYIDYFFKNFQKYKSRYNKIIYINHEPDKCNKILKELGCPYIFTKLPRTGYSALFKNIVLGKKIFITNWSIFNESRVSHYVQENCYESICHEKTDEIKILNWLHVNNFVDASLCLLLDKKSPTFYCKDIKPSKFIIKKIKDEYNECMIIE